MAARRSRTGCATCRSRKLKCDEVKPICGHCAKSRRECVPSEGVPFRHEQNAGLNAKGPGLKLANFYKDRPIFTPEQTQNFLPIPASLQWRHITDPYNEHDLEQPSPRPASPQAYQQQIASAASHSLTMLASVAAPGNQTYQPPITYDASIYPGGNVGYGPAGSLQGPNQISSIPSLLNHDKSNADSNNIDPSLDTSIIEGLREAAESAASHSSSAKHGTDTTTEEGDHNVANEEELRALLKGYDGQTA